MMLKKIRDYVRKQLKEVVLGILPTSEGHIVITERHFVYVSENNFMAILHQDISSYGIGGEDMMTFFVTSKNRYRWDLKDTLITYWKAKRIFGRMENLPYYREFKTKTS